MDYSEIAVGIAKAAAPPTILGLQLGEWGVVLAIVAALFNIITTWPAVWRLVKGWFNKEK